MSRVYFEGWYSGFYDYYVKAEDWYKDNLVYVNLRGYAYGASLSRPAVEKSFLVRFDYPERIAHYDGTIAEILSNTDEKRDQEGRLIPISITLPQIDICGRG